MKSSIVNSPIQGQVIFNHGTQFSRGCYHARCVDIFVEDTNAPWTEHVSKIRLTGLAISRPSPKISDTHLTIV